MEVWWCMLAGMVIGLIIVASNPSAYFAALGLVMAAGMGCGVLVTSGGSFLPLILFLIYLGGMLVVFAYTAALAAEAHPQTLGSRPVMVFALGYALGSLGISSLHWKGWNSMSSSSVDEMSNSSSVRGDMTGAGMVYSNGGGVLIASAWALVLALLSVLELTRGLARGVLRVPEGPAGV
nr:NADH dehydrogenase subunit 6 [Otophidium dormitator]